MRSYGTASAVSRLLRQGGLRPLGSGTPAEREGIRVSGTSTGVYIRISLDSELETVERIEDI